MFIGVFELAPEEGLGQLTAQFSMRYIAVFTWKTSYSCTIRLNWIEWFLTRTLSVSHSLSHPLAERPDYPVGEGA